MRSSTIARLCYLALLPASFALAQQPPNLEPLPEVPLPPQLQVDPKTEPEVKSYQKGEDKVEEFRVGGKLYMIRVTPPGGVPYVLLDESGAGKFGPPSGGPTDAYNISVPMWVIGTF